MCVLVMLTEGGEMKLNTNINFLLEEFGVMANNGEWPAVEVYYYYVVHDRDIKRNKT